MMRSALTALVLGCLSQTVFAADILYFSCPALDKSADDLLVVIDQPNGKASLQSEKSGSGLNFTSSASFGPKQVTWRSDSRSYPQKFSLDRVTLTLRRETSSGMTGTVYEETSPCSMVKSPGNTKF
ncbi:MULTISPECIES: hypothetical protein [Pseudomonas]|uniref:hypothetical protein n=1 Tax=Pseudomonas TaxID=286 RepID=UPI0010109B16|nr:MULTISPECIES: hypothetical protein [Pseudomonas]NAP01942.1 hypothetical protein [Pseudomonas syringae]NAP22465.1 hypothetical protein [Pseudomonas syringae]NAP48534.1 hypothetical protein [Pseudomonas syringae]NAP82520.1 hypothetical protein [Pseudomonas syringae]NAQ13520.1 hypothetical protein [Pseudomonas syringae]